MPEAKLIEVLLEKAVQDLLSRRRFPEATYRLQFHAGFTFQDARRLVPYLHDLGITDCYASPYLKARPGSQHGYDIQDHRVLNPEIGSEDDYNAWIEALHSHGMGQIFDMVPNHMGIVGNENIWWNDVLENGPSSPYAGFFDIDWFSYKPTLHEKVLLPVLGDTYDKVLEAGQLNLDYAAGAFTINYFEHRFPVSPCSYGRILSYRLGELEQALGKTAEPFIEYQSILTAIGHLPPSFVTDPVQVAERHREKEVIKRRLAALTEASAPVREFIEQNVAVFNGQAGDPHSFDPLDELLNEQAYRLAFWRVATDEINYRRFFDVNELAALSMENLEVFTATHELVLRLLREGKVNGLRIDHPDGLYNPRQYLQRLQESYALECVRAVAAADPQYRDLPWEEFEGPVLAAIRKAAHQEDDPPWRRPLYVVVEKILGKGEPLPEGWPVYGTTGYEFLNALGGLFVDTDQAQTFTRIYQRFSRNRTPVRDTVYQKKFQILQAALAGELHMLGHQLDRLAQKHRWSRDFTLNSLRHALREIIACFPVYRSYISEDGIPPRDPFYVHTAVIRAKHKNPAISGTLFDFVRDMLLLKYLKTADEPERAEQYRFAGKFQQVTAPVMAKGLEDTAFYVYNRLLSLNEVGGDPEQFGISVTAFHRHNQDRQRLWSWNLSTTSTHDTKRSADIRARLNALSELPRDWLRCLMRWREMNRRHQIALDEEATSVPDPNVEYFIYQTLLGAWPLEPLAPGEYPQFVERIQAYLQKAIHEAKEHTSWINPDRAYDEAVRQFVDRLLDKEDNHEFVEDLRGFARRLSHYGLFNSLSQVLLKIASPGVPDTYQGTELWDFSLVDPDNRRPVDYAKHHELLQQIKAEASGDLPEYCRELTRAKEDGRIKLYATYRGLNCRRDNPGLFATGQYVPLETTGVRADNVCAFARVQEGRCAIVAVPRLVTQLVRGVDDMPLGPAVWQDTALELPEALGQRSYRNVFTGEIVGAAERLAVAELMANFPVTLLLAEE
jgi:(1->4)-alpha-D-glucan 1-alpha-D-glucosylmutase